MFKAQLCFWWIIQWFCTFASHTVLFWQDFLDMLLIGLKATLFSLLATVTSASSSIGSICAEFLLFVCSQCYKHARCWLWCCELFSVDLLWVQITQNDFLERSGVSLEVYFGYNNTSWSVVFLVQWGKNSM